MDLSTLANLINAFAVTAALIFAAAQIGYYRQRRRRDAMLELVRSFQSPAFTSALLLRRLFLHLAKIRREPGIHPLGKLFVFQLALGSVSKELCQNFDERRLLGLAFSPRAHA